MDKAEWLQMVQTIQHMGFQILQVDIEKETLLICPMKTR